MAARLPYVIEKNGSHYIRLVVPKPLRPFIERNKGEIIRPLGHSLKEVKANHARALSSAQDELDAARERKAQAEGVELARTGRRYARMTHSTVEAVAAYVDSPAGKLSQFLQSDEAMAFILSAGSYVEETLDVQERDEWIEELIAQAVANGEGSDPERYVLGEVEHAAENLEIAGQDLRDLAALIQRRRDARMVPGGRSNALANPPHGHDTPDGVDWLEDEMTKAAGNLNKGSGR